MTPVDRPIAFRFLKPESRRAKPPVDDFGLAYVNGNIAEGYELVSADNWTGGVQVESIGDPDAILESIRRDQPFPHAYLEIESAKAAYHSVLENSGATRPRRDAVDKRVVDMVRSGTVSYDKGIITDIQQVGGYPEYRGSPYVDRDADGIADSWEIDFGLDPEDASDVHADTDGDGYSTIEEYINGTDPKEPDHAASGIAAYVDLWSSDPQLKARLERE